MRIHPVLCAVIVVVVAATAGCQLGAGKQCVPACGANQACVQGVCEGCGLLQEACCPSNSGHGVCNPGQGVCNDEINASCTNSCGTVGKPCCDGVCPGGGLCNAAGSCDPIPEVCLGGSNQHTIDVIDATCHVHPATILLSSDAVEAACAAALEAQLDPGGANQLQFCPVDVPPGATPVCDTSTGMSPSLWNCGVDQVAICIANLCPDTCVLGSCP